MAVQAYTHYPSDNGIMIFVMFVAKHFFLINEDDVHSFNRNFLNTNVPTNKANLKTNPPSFLLCSCHHLDFELNSKSDTSFVVYSCRLNVTSMFNTN